MARSYFALFPGVLPPSHFKAVSAPELLTISDVWEAARKSPPSLLFRVRSESEPGDNVVVEDRLESCVGVVDAVTRWRSIFAMSRQMITAIRQPALRQLCGQAMQFISTQHPANVTQEQRLGIIGELMRIVEQGAEGQPAPTPFEKEVAVGIARLAGADNDIEAAHYIPFLGALNPFHADEHKAEYAARMATIETTSGAVLLTEAGGRLGERVPQWLSAAMPGLELPGASEASARERDRGED